MTLQEFDAALKEACPETYELAAPQSATRYVVWHRYGTQSSYADDRNVLNCAKVQIDIVTQNKDDFLVDDVCAALWLADLPYSVQSEGYDPEYNAFRTILQLVVA